MLSVSGPSAAIGPPLPLNAESLLKLAGQIAAQTAELVEPGSLDLTFGIDGAALAFVGGSLESGRAVVLQPDGKIVAVGDSVIENRFGFSVARFNGDGSLDDQFGTTGSVATPVGPGTSGARAVVLQSDGKLIAAGYAAASANNYDFALVRYNSDGTLDTTFGSGGSVLTDIGGELDEIKGLSLQSDGKIVAAGYKSDRGSQLQFAVARYNSNGTLDTGFGTGGITLTSVGGGNDEARAVAIQPDGRIVAAGHWQNGSNYDFALARFNADGSLDTSFGTGGKLTTAVGSSSEYARAVVVQADGRIVAAGFSNIAGTDDFALVRYNSDGTLDTTFGVGGKRTTSFGTGQDTAYALTLQPDGKLIAVGYSHNGSNYDFAVARYTTEGALDASFDSDGRVTTAVGVGGDEAYGAALQSDGKLIVVGSSVRDSTYDLAVVRYHMALQPTQVVGSQLFYNNSQYDNDSADASAADDAAIAMDKVALLPGSTATLGNYTSYSRGINGVIVDFANLASSTLVASDFLFRIGNDSSPGTWAIASAPTSVTVRPGQGVSGSDRVMLIWPDYAIKNTWLEVTVLPTANTGLAEPYVFYYGNAVGESGGSSGNAVVNSTDELGARNHPQTFLDPAAIDNVYDYNRDGFVNATDQIIARSNATTLATSLKLISVPSNLQNFVQTGGRLAESTVARLATSLSAAESADAAAIAPPLPQRDEPSQKKADVAFGLAVSASGRLAEQPAIAAAASVGEWAVLSRAIYSDASCPQQSPKIDFSASIVSKPSDHLDLDEQLFDLIAEELVASQI